MSKKHTQNLFEVIRKPLVSEKSTRLSEKHSTLTLKVLKTATKYQISDAIENLFQVKVASVQTVTIPGKVKRRGKITGRTASWKKAYVSLQNVEDTKRIDETLLAGGA